MLVHAEAVLSNEMKVEPEPYVKRLDGPVSSDHCCGHRSEESRRKAATYNWLPQELREK